MAKFEPAVALTLEHEGGFVDNPNDKGHATKYGITQRDMPDVDIRDITPEQASVYYREHYWKPGMTNIVNQDAANKLFDVGVLFGVGTAVRLAQAVLGVPQDGAFGETTLLALNGRGEAFLEPYKARLVVHVRWIVAKDPTQEVFLKGWINRINS